MRALWSNRVFVLMLLTRCQGLVERVLKRSYGAAVWRFLYDARAIILDA